MPATRKELGIISAGLLGLGLTSLAIGGNVTETLTVVWLLGSAFLINYIETSDISSREEIRRTYYGEDLPDRQYGGGGINNSTEEPLRNMFNSINGQVTEAFKKQKLEEKKKKEINDQISTLMEEIIELYRKNSKNSKDPFTNEDIERILQDNKYSSLKTFASTLKLEINKEHVQQVQQQVQDELSKMGKGGKKIKTYKKRANLKKRKSAKRTRTTKRR